MLHNILLFIALGETVFTPIMRRSPITKSLSEDTMLTYETNVF